MFGGLSTVLWDPQAHSPGVRTNQFAFTITGTTNLAVVVEACTNLANPVWAALGTHSLTGGASYFSDPQWTNYPTRFYRLLATSASSARIVYVSKIPGIHQAGSFTDGTTTTSDEVAINAVLHGFDTNGGGILVQDGISVLNTNAVTTHTTLVSGDQTSLLYVGNNTTIICLPGCGFVAAPHSDCPLLGNYVNGLTNQTTWQSNLMLIGGTYWGNWANQDKKTNLAGTSAQVFEQNLTNNAWVMGAWFSGFKNLRMSNVEIRDASAFAVILANGDGADLDRVWCHWTLDRFRAPETPHWNWDGLHFWADLTNVKITHYRNTLGCDDALAFNTDEGQWLTTNYWPAMRWPQRMPTNIVGTIKNVAIDDVFLDKVYSGIRWLGDGAVTSPLVDNISINNVYGGIQVANAMNNGGLTFGHVSISGWHPTNYSSINIGSTNASSVVSVTDSQFENYPASTTIIPIQLAGGQCTVDNVQIETDGGYLTSAIKIYGAEFASLSDVSFNANQDWEYLLWVPTGYTVTNLTFAGINMPVCLRGLVYGPGTSPVINVTIVGNGATTIGNYAFEDCSSLTSLTIGNGVTSLGDYAFRNCSGLTSVTIGSSVSRIGIGTFAGCTSLTGVYFQGNAPSLGPDVFPSAPATIYYLPGSTGWGATFGGLPTKQWNPPPQISLAGLGVQKNQFGFTITGTTNLAVVVEACTKLANPIWSPVGTNTLADGAAYFSDPQWTNYPARFYRLRSP
jgi:hypothetical protein